MSFARFPQTVTLRPRTHTAYPVHHAGILQRKCACGTKSSRTGSCPKCGDDEKRDVLERKAHGDREFGEVPPSVFDVLRSSGQPLDAATRALMEQRFGHDFSRVRVHALASDSADSVHSVAYPGAISGTAQELTLGTGPGYVPIPASPTNTSGCTFGRSESNCDQWTGDYKILKIDNDCCTRRCTEEHEQIHVNDHERWGCCRAFSQAWTAELSKAHPNTGPIRERFTDWFEIARPVTECHAYLNDLRCAEQMAIVNGCASTGPADRSRAVAAAGDDAIQEESAFATAQRSSLREWPRTTRSDCCNDIAVYMDAMSLEADHWCNQAKGAAVPPCPFSTGKAGKAISKANASDGQ